MHEFPITEQIVKICSKRCGDEGGSGVTKLKLVCGERTGYVPESVQMYFDIISVDTPCEGAAVEIETVRSKMRCPACGKLFYRKPLSFECPDCGTDGEPTEIGKEFYIEYIEVE